MSVERLLKFIESCKREASSYQQVFDNVPCGIVEFSSKGEVLFINAAAAKTFKRSQKDFQKTTLHDFFMQSLSAADFPRLQSEFQEIYTKKKESSRLVVRLKADAAKNRGSWILQFQKSKNEQDSYYLFVQPTIVAKPFSELDHDSLDFERILFNGQLVIIRTDDEFRITDLIGDTKSLFGLTTEQVLTRPTIWSDIMTKSDFLRLTLRVRRMEQDPIPFKEQIRIIPRGADSSLWLMLQVIPVFDEQDLFIGWEGFGVDVTEKRNVELDLLSERKRIAALYELSRALQVNLDPEFIALKGLKAMIQATESDAGFCCFYDSKKEIIDIIAAQGLSERFLTEISGVVKGRESIVRYVVQQNQGTIIPDIQKDSRSSSQGITAKEGLRSVIVTPLSHEAGVIGAIVVLHEQENAFTQEDYDLIQAGSSQIALAARQAEFYQAERREADSQAVLYKLSHHLSKLFTTKEVAESAFSLIQEEFSCKRLWLGIMNEQATHIIGQAAAGPGMRDSIKNLHIELEEKHKYLDQAIRTKKPVIVSDGNASAGCPGLNRLLTRLQLGAYIIFPLVSVRRVVGVCIIEPTISSTSLIKRKLPLLSSMTNEIATVILARRFEQKLADSDKMRMASVLASGIAHNFNNLLQAVMGQASLIEMQLPDTSPLVGAAKTIVQAAEKGASLVRHMLVFSNQGTGDHKTFAANTLLTDSKDFLSSMLGKDIYFDMKITPESLMIKADYAQIQQVLHYILVNASEAVNDRENGTVRLELHQARLRSGEVAPELSPGTYVRIDIEDNGIGMTEDQKIRCFEPFFSTKEVDMSTGISLSGSGLGLFSAYSIVRHHGGSISLDSTLGEGTLVSIYLPVASESPLEKSLEFSTPPVLIVDVKSTTSYAVRSTLESFGLDSEIESDMKEVRKLLSSPDTEIQLVVIDIERIGEYALDLLDYIRKIHTHLTFVFCTVDRARWTREIKTDKNTLLIEKPLSVWAIQSVVRELFPGMSTKSLQDNIEVRRSQDNRPVETDIKIGHQNVLEKKEKRDN